MIHYLGEGGVVGVHWLTFRDGPLGFLGGGVGGMGGLVCAKTLLFYLYRYGFFFFFFAKKAKVGLSQLQDIFF